MSYRFYPILSYRVGGNNAILNQINKIQVVGGKIDNVEACTTPVQQGDKIEIGGSIVHVYDSPCHTKGHVLYYTGRAVFTGDTMFAAGCGMFMCSSICFAVSLQ
jgi:hydroxyacylglutathione hydrolase